MLYTLRSSYLMIQVCGRFIFLVYCDFYHHITSLFVSLNAFGFEGPFITPGMFLFPLSLCLLYTSLLNRSLFTFLYRFVLNVLQITQVLIFNQIRLPLSFDGGFSTSHLLQQPIYLDFFPPSYFIFII